MHEGFRESLNGAPCRLGWLALLLASAAGCSTNDSTPASSGDAGAEAGAQAPSLDFGAFDSAINAFLTEKGLAGASAVGVQKNYGIVHESGYGQVAANRPYLIAPSGKGMRVG